MNDLERRVTSVLGGIADAVDAPDSRLADTAMTRGKRRRRARALAAVAGAVVVVGAVAVPFTLSVTGDDGRSGTLITNQTPEPSQPPRPAPRSRVTVLPRGSAPALPYATNAAPWQLVDGDLRVPLPAHRLSTPLGRFGESYVVFVRHSHGDDPDADLRVVEPSGVARTLAHGRIYGAVVSPDEAGVAWSRRTHLRDTLLVRSATVDGTVLGSVRVRGAYVHTVGYSPDGVVLSITPNSSPSGQLAIWSGTDGEQPTVLASNVSPVALSADGKHMLVQSGSDQECATLVAIPSGHVEWHRCAAPVAVSPDGRIVVVDKGDCDWSVVVADNGGAPFLCRISGRGGAVWEDATHLLVPAVDNGHGYVLRCSVLDGECERALDPASTEVTLLAR